MMSQNSEGDKETLTTNGTKERDAPSMAKTTIIKKQNRFAKYARYGR